MFVSSGVIFAWDLIFCLFKCIASNERRRDFCIKQVYGFLFFFLKRTKFYLSFDRGLTLVSELGTMSTNKERIENLEVSFGDLQTKSDRMEVDVINSDKLKLLLVGCLTS